jgi:hypothetical protein
MKLADSSLEMFVATLQRDYLAHADSIRAGVPDNTALPKKVFDMAVQPELPSLVIVAKENGSKGAHRIVSLSFMQMARLVADDVNAAEVTNAKTTAELLASMAKIEQRLRTMKTGEDDGGPLLGWRDWYDALDAEWREGYRILKIVHQGCAPIHRKTDQRVIIAACTMDVHLVLVPV